MVYGKGRTLGRVGLLALSVTAGSAAYADDSLMVRSSIDENLQLREHVGLSKQSTVAKTDIDKTLAPTALFSSLKLHATLRGSYDGVYDLNSHHFGNNAGGPVSFTQNAGGQVAYGAGAVSLFGANTASAGYANQGMALLSGYRGEDHGIDLAVPVRPCDVDHRGCLKNYMDGDKLDLAAPEFNKRLDVLREAFVEGEIPVGSNTLALRVGRQQLVWGRTDLFRVLDVVNPIDYSRNNIYDENSEIRIPMGMVRADYRMGARGPFDDLNVQGLWVFENFRPNNLGQGGSTNNPLGAAGFFRGMKNCWDNGCTVNNFAGGVLATNFGANQIGIRAADVPVGLKSDTYGGKVEGEAYGVGFSLNALSALSQMPSLRGGVKTVDPFTGAMGTYPSSLAFDIKFPRVNLYGGSLDFNIEPLKTSVRVETVYTQGEEFANTARSQLYSKSDVIRYVLGIDRNTFIPVLNPKRAFLFSGQVFGTHLSDYELHKTASGTTGMPDWQDNWIATLLIKGWFEADTISPQIVAAHDFKGRANVVEPSIEILPSNNWRIKFGASVKFGNERNAFDDNRSALPYPAIGGPAASAGSLSGMLPLGSFRTGVIGMAGEETQLFGTVSYRF